MNSLSENNNILLKSTETHSTGLSNVNEVWTKNIFANLQLNQKPDLSLKLDTSKMSWVNHDIKSDEVVTEKVEVKEEEEDDKMDVDVKSPTTPDQEASSPSHHARRPMNAFLIFCKKHRPIVRKKYPNLENRGVTRILGEWWALLDANDKLAYTDLAREYKDAFFNANPNFKWYKLPAPPLRTQPIRPINVKQEPSPPMSPTNLSNQTPEFTPGKLADESQLGKLSSLLSITNQHYNNKSETDLKQTTKHEPLCNNNNETENNNKEDFMSQFQSPVSCNQNATLPPKPIKKRVVESYTDNKTITRNIFETESNISEQSMTNNDLNMTNQQIVNKVVASQFLDDADMKNGYKDTRKSGRKCKGNRYAEFMANGKLLKNKRDKRESTNIETPKLDLNNTIRRLEERIQPKTNDDAIKQERTRTISEISDTDDYSKSIPSFNLSERISELPSLSYDSYLQRKKENKKRKFVKKQPQHKAKTEMSVETNKNNLTGSKKRKNKHNITHLEKNDNFTNTFNNDLSGLATLAEIAAFKEKITN